MASPCPRPLAGCPVMEKESAPGCHQYGWYFIAGWVILFLLIWVLIVSFCPKWCCKHERECDDDESHEGKRGPIDYSRVALWAFIISLIIVIIIWAVWSCSSKMM